MSGKNSFNNFSFNGQNAGDKDKEKAKANKAKKKESVKKLKEKMDQMKKDEATKQDAQPEQPKQPALTTKRAPTPVRRAPTPVQNGDHQPFKPSFSNPPAKAYNNNFYTPPPAPSAPQYQQQPQQYQQAPQQPQPQQGMMQVSQVPPGYQVMYVVAYPSGGQPPNGQMEQQSPQEAKEPTNEAGFQFNRKRSSRMGSENFFNTFSFNNFDERTKEEKQLTPEEEEARRLRRHARKKEKKRLRKARKKSKKGQKGAMAADDPYAVRAAAGETNQFIGEDDWDDDADDVLREILPGIRRQGYHGGSEANAGGRYYDDGNGGYYPYYPEGYNPRVESGDDGYYDYSKNYQLAERRSSRTAEFSFNRRFHFIEKQ